MAETIKLPDFPLVGGFMSEQLSALLNVIYVNGPIYNIIEVRLLTPQSQRQRKGHPPAISEARDVSIFNSGHTENGNLRRSHHDMGNNLMISQYEGTLRLITGGDKTVSYDIRLLPLPAASRQQLATCLVEESIDNFTDNLAAYLPKVKPFASAVSTPGFSNIGLPADIMELLALLPQRPDNCKKDGSPISAPT